MIKQKPFADIAMKNIMERRHDEAPALPVEIGKIQASFGVCVKRHEALLTRLLASYDKHLKRLTKENDK